jgi:hypothetical protein
MIIRVKKIKVALVVVIMLDKVKLQGKVVEDQEDPKYQKPLMMMRNTTKMIYEYMLVINV